MRDFESKIGSYLDSMQRRYPTLPIRTIWVQWRFLPKPIRESYGTFEEYAECKKVAS